MSERKGTKALELWCKRLVKDCPEVKIENMTTSWRNGLAFCALVHHFRPDLIDMTKLKPEDVYENNRLAFSIAEKHLGIPSLLDPEDMVENEVPDRLSVLTYLSQFYQRLGHTVNTKTSESDSKGSASPSTSPAVAPIQFGKTALDKCAVCELPVYLAQRLIVSHKLYHRRCFRCSKCSGQMNPNNYELTNGSDFICDSCKNDKSLPNLLNNNDQMGMLAFDDDVPTSNQGVSFEKANSPKRNIRPHSVLDKISIFESKDTSIENIENLSLKDSPGRNIKNTIKSDKASISNEQSVLFKDSTEEASIPTMGDRVDSSHDNVSKNISEKSYKSNADKFIFLQTQLSSDTKLESSSDKDFFETVHKNDPISDTDKDADTEKFRKNIKEDSNITDDLRIANTITSFTDSPTIAIEPNNTGLEQSITVTVPPRKSKLQNSSIKAESVAKQASEAKVLDVEYPDDLNPFSDDEEEEDPPCKTTTAEKKESTNPFGSSDDEEADVVPPKLSPPKITVSRDNTPVRRLIAVNPFWSDGEEPSSDEDSNYESPKKPYESGMATSTPNLPSGPPRRRKAPAPPPPTAPATNPPPPAAPSPIPTAPSPAPAPATSLDDVNSLSSLSSHNSTIPDHKYLGTPSPRSMKRLAPTPPESLSGCGTGSEDCQLLTPQGGGSRTKRPAPGLPLPERRSVKLQMSPEELQVQLDILETQQLGLERQGVMIEQMIRDKCEGDEACTVPQEEVEDLVIQLCELVNEKNDLFRKQTELMYIRRQQRLEQEQADIEHEIRVIQSRPAVNRIDADKAREEQLVSRLVCIVRMRDSLVQQIEAERRRERQEDLAIAASIATKRAQRNSESNSSSLKSDVVAATPKKNKVKDKVKKQLKKAKHSLISKKRDETADRKDTEKGKLSKQ